MLDDFGLQTLVSSVPDMTSFFLNQVRKVGVSSVVGRIFTQAIATFGFLLSGLSALSHQVVTITFNAPWWVTALKGGVAVVLQAKYCTGPVDLYDLT